MNTPFISIIICTKNRAFILPECLDSLLNQTIDHSNFEVIVVDNGSKDRTNEVIMSYSSKFANIKYIFEQNIGLSFARNSGFKAAAGEWVLYLDDDSKAAPCLIERAIWTINNFNFDCFGGRYFAWYKYGKPSWFAENYGTMPLLLPEVGILERGGISGGIMVIKRIVLENLRGFSIDYGMKESVGYGEEDELQQRMLAKGYTIGFDPELQIYHCVLPHKLKLSWHINAAYAKGRDQVKLGLIAPSSKYLVLREVLCSFFLRLPYGIFRLLLKKGFYWQNLLLSLARPIAIQLGAYYASRKS